MGFLEDRDLTGVPTIPNYFKDKTIFITGGSGFIGKVLIEKLLYSCTDVKRIYLLLRTKKGICPVDRLENLYKIPCFDRLRKEKPDVFKSKVRVVSGDVMDEELGLSKEDRQRLIKEVNIIFHVAASVRFDDPIKYAIKLNLCGTIKVMDLAKEMKNISSIVHVSTSYSNSNRNPVDEIMYPPLANWRDMIDIVDKVDEQTLRVLTSKLLGEIPNTYTFAKQLAEHVVYELRGTLPIVMYRPSIVISSAKEPIPGWIDNFNGPVALLVASAAGILRSVYTNPDMEADYIPVDMSAQGLIVAAWIRGTKNLDPADDIEIYNCCSGKIQKVTYGEMIEIGRSFVDMYPLERCLWYPGGSITYNKYYHYFRFFFLQLLPAIMIDCVLKIAGKKPMLVKVQRKIWNAEMALRYYTLHQWTFHHTNFLALRSAIKDEDKNEFYYDLEGLDRYEFFRNSAFCAREQLMKEKIDNLPKALARNRKLKLLDRFVKIVACLYFVWWFISLNIVQSTASCCYEFVFIR